MSSGSDKNTGENIKDSYVILKSTDPNESSDMNTALTLTNPGENSNECDLVNFQQQFQQFMSETGASNLLLKTMQDDLKNSFKRNILLKQELESEKLNKSMMKIELETLTAITNASNDNNVESDVSTLAKELGSLSNRIHKLQLENMKSKQKLKMSNSQVSSLMENHYKYRDKIDLFTSLLNSLQEQTKKLENEKYLLVKTVRAAIVLAKKYLYARDHSKHLLKSESDHMQLLIREIANIKSDIHMCVKQNEVQSITRNDQETPTHLEMYKNLVKTLEAENNALHNNIKLMIE